MKTYHVNIPTDFVGQPRPYELSAAQIVARFLQHDVDLLCPGIDKTPDFKIGSMVWELKSPRGNSKNTIANTFKTARKQSKNIIIDLRRCKMKQTEAIARLKFHCQKRKNEVKSLSLRKTEMCLTFLKVTDIFIIVILKLL